MIKETKAVRPLRYRKSGGVRQAQLEEGSQLSLLAQLDPKEWIVLSLPSSGHEMSDATLAAIDTDNDGRIRVKEVREAVAWLQCVLTDLNQLKEGSDEVELKGIRDDTKEGKAIVISIRLLMELLEKEEADFSLKELEAGKKILESTAFSGEGILDEKVTDDPEIKQLILDIIATVGGAETRREKTGVTVEGVKRFYNACESYLEWYEKGQEEESMAQLFPVGDRTEAAVAAFEEVADKIDAWFSACDTFSYAPDLVKEEEEAPHLEERPLAGIRDLRSLPLEEQLNPAWKKRLFNFKTLTVDPVFKEEKTELSRADWRLIKKKFSAYREWRKGEYGSVVSPLGHAQIKGWMDKHDVRGKLEALLAKDLDLKDDIDGVASVERLLRLKRDFWEFLENFVNFNRFYDLSSNAIFQVGTLYLDGRSFHLCVPVKDQKAHSALAGKSGLCLLYCRLTRPGTTVTPIIAAAVTNGNNRRLMVGKHGIFYDREGLEWDANVFQVVEQPINLRQAVMEPFRRLGSLLVSHVEKLSTAREKAIQTELAGSVSNLEKNVATNVPEKTAPAPEKQSAGVGGFLAGGGVALAALASSLAFLSSTLSKVNNLYLLYAVGVFILLILLPTTIIAWLRLRARDIGLLLEAGGWAINAPMRLTAALGRRLTQLSRYGR